MIIKSELSKVLKFIRGGKIFIDPTYTKELHEVIRVFPLLINTTLLYYNKNNQNLLRIQKKSKDLIEENFFVPVVISEKNLDDDLLSSKYIIRNKLLDESLFSIDYKKSIKKDYEDENFKELVKSSLNIPNRTFNEMFSKISFSINWNLIFSQIVNTPLLLDSAFQNIFKYKCDNLLNSYYYPQSLAHIFEVRKFISKVNPILPSNLDIDQIKKFRNEKVAIQFRNWLEESITNIYDKEKFDKIKISDYLYKEFNELSKSYADKSNLISYSFSGVLAGLIGAITTGSPITSAISAGGGIVLGHPFSKLLKKIWKQKGPNSWVFLLNEIK